MSEILIHFVIQTLKINEYSSFGLITLNYFDVSNMFPTGI